VGNRKTEEEEMVEVAFKSCVMPPKALLVYEPKAYDMTQEEPSFWDKIKKFFKRNKSWQS
jgi:hypothetical protein